MSDDDQLRQIMFDHLNNKLTLPEALRAAYNLGSNPVPF